jgi:hypothetical protein|tara:strand:- start:2150 stop:2593 length:444 start_codon:yes stop_codon:yes gene_type:complete
MYQRFNISLRLPAHLFVEKDCEEMVVEKIKECYSKINTSWTLKFAMDTNLIDAKPVVDFAKRHDKLFKHRTSFKPSDSINVNDYVLFEVEDSNNPLPNSDKFMRSRYTYKTQVGELIPKGLDDYIKISNFILSVNQRKTTETSRQSK